MRYIIAEAETRLRGLNIHHRTAENFCFVTVELAEMVSVELREREEIFCPLFQVLLKYFLKVAK